MRARLHTIQHFKQTQSERIFRKTFHLQVFSNQHILMTNLVVSFHLQPEIVSYWFWAGKSGQRLFESKLDKFWGVSLCMAKCRLIFGDYCITCSLHLVLVCRASTPNVEHVRYYQEKTLLSFISMNLSIPYFHTLIELLRITSIINYKSLM